jgi:hypothetical protein
MELRTTAARAYASVRTRLDHLLRREPAKPRWYAVPFVRARAWLAGLRRRAQPTPWYRRPLHR